MSFFSIPFLLLLVFTVWSSPGYAFLYVDEPSSIKICHGGQPCTFQWLDNGVAPLLPEIGACHVALYNGEQHLVQQIDPVNVAAVHSVQFVPNPAAGPDSSQYYLNFTSVNQIRGTSYQQFTSFFRLDQMSGSLGSGISSLTSAIPVPSSLLATSTSSVTSSLPAITSGMSISRTSSSTASSPSGSTTGSGNTQSNSSRHRLLLDPLQILFSSVFVIFTYI